MKIKKYHTARRAVRMILLLVLAGLPFLRISNESALRFDVPTLRLLFFGTEIPMADFFLILAALIFLTFFTLFATSLFGRLWCGWLCPQTVLMDAAADAGRPGRMPGIPPALTAIPASALIAASLVFYFVSPYDLPDILATGGIAAKIAVGSWAVLSVFLYLDIILQGRKFCATVCPYAKMQSVLFDDRTLQVAFDSARSAECMDCRACVKACPVGIDIRDGSQMECIHCAECIDACTGRMNRRNRKSLISYSFGLPGSGSGSAGLRINPLITGIITGITLIFLVYLSLSRLPFDVSVRLNYTAEPARKTDGTVTNLYEFSFRNATSAELPLRLSAKSDAGDVKLLPSEVIARPGADSTRIPVAMTVSAGQNDGRNIEVLLSIRAPGLDREISRTVYFVMPKQ